MPRDLTDLMERATSSAPPEPHAAADITRLAAYRQRRRTTGLAAAVAVAVVAAAGLGYGVTRGQDTAPQPAGQFKRDQTVDVSSAVPASTLPGYHLEPWTVPSVQDFGSEYSPLPTYREVDAHGRLIVEDAPGGDPQGPLRIRLYDGPGLGPRPVEHPPSPGSNGGRPITWIPSFLNGDRLIWRAPGLVHNADEGFHVTDLAGGHDAFVHTGFHLGRTYFDGTPGPETSWLEGDRFWFLVYSSADPRVPATTYTLYSATFAGALTKVADNVAVAAVSDGQVGWVTTDGKVATVSAAGGSPHSVDVPLDAGCRVSPSDFLQLAHPFVVGRSLMGLTEQCGAGKTRRNEALLFDRSGHSFAHITGVSVFTMSWGGDVVVMTATDPGTGSLELLRYDLVTGSLARLSPASKDRTMQDPQAAGDYVLWYDAKGGHVARIPG